MFPEPFGSPSVSLTNQFATQVPFGSAVGTGTVMLRSSDPTSRRPSVTSTVLHSRAIVLASPSSSENTMLISVGDVAIVDPSAGVELTTLASANALPAPNIDPMIATVMAPRPRRTT